MEPLRLALLDEIPDGACVVSENRIVVYWNRRLEEWTGIPRAAIVGQELSEQLPYLCEGEPGQQLENLLRHGTPPPDGPGFRLFADAPIPDGLADDAAPEPKQRVLRASLSPFRALDVCRYALLLARDETALARQAEEVERLQEQLSETDGVRRQLEDRLRDALGQFETERARCARHAHELSRLQRAVAAAAAAQGVAPGGPGPRPGDPGAD